MGSFFSVTKKEEKKAKKKPKSIDFDLFLFPRKDEHEGLQTYVPGARLVVFYSLSLGAYV